MSEYNLEPIFEFNMNDEEIVAYKLGLLWMNTSCQIFPDYKHSSRFPAKGDPRKSSLFKYCYKLMKSTKGLINANEYQLYITAQLQILKSIEIGNTHPLIGPQCLVGPKAWTRWKVWKKKYDTIGKSQTLKDVGLDKADFEELKNELPKTRKFMKGKFGDLTEDLFQFKRKEIERYISLGMISGFYAVLSPWVSKYCNLDNVDLNYYRIEGTEAQEYFKKLFPEEYIK